MCYFGIVSFDPNNSRTGRVRNTLKKTNLLAAWSQVPLVAASTEAPPYSLRALLIISLNPINFAFTFIRAWANNHDFLLLTGKPMSPCRASITCKINIKYRNQFNRTGNRFVC